ncbi:uncharacterized protein LOC132275987 isoform X2 [Cornus florida]|uniref:uncharacterized protein LOC132275987 isoform X2 n=1 Tax=Cornus florida TaxID=4283 RepID=UPI00289B32EC|nr:uncharacterized protein LOC132275987 isoform X2 [Cornus florida]
MLRLCNRTRRCIRFSLLRRTFSSPPSSSASPRRHPEVNSVQCPKDLNNPQRVPSPPILHHHPTSLSLLPSSSLSRSSALAISATLISAIVASYALISTNPNDESKPRSYRIYDDLDHAIERYNESFKKIVNRMKQTGVAASVLWQSLRSVLSSANHGVRSGFELRVAALLADIAAANASRRAAIVGAGGGAVLDWLLETVATSGDNCGTQAEAARALAYLIADPNVCEMILGRPHAVPNLLRFIFTTQPQKTKKQPRRSSFDVSDSLKGRSMLVAAIMDIVTESLDKVSFKPLLPEHAEMRDIAAAIQVIEEGGMHLDESHGAEDDENGGKGMRGIGIKILGGTTVVGLSRTNGMMELESSGVNDSDSVKYTPKNLLFNKINNTPQAPDVVPGLWDDLHCQHVAVPFATWALANWAMASEANRSHINELDQDGCAVMTALMAPERSVKWHGSLVARLLLEDHSLPLNDSVSDWSSSLLSTVSQASKTEDIPLTQVALSAFLVSIERCPVAKKVIMEKGLNLMRETAKRMTKHKNVQEALAKALESLSTGDMHLSFEESQKWSGILLHWIFGKFSSDAIRSSAIKILSRILEDHGPSSIPISQGWLAILLSDILKTTSTKGTQPKNDKVKTKVDQTNILSAAQTANLLASAVVNLAVNQLGAPTDSADAYPLADLLALEPFAGPFKNLKKDNLPKIDAADSALATLKGIKALTEVCAEDSLCQNKIADFGVLCLLRRFLLRDDYEQLAANEAYDASRALESQERVTSVPGKSSVVDTNDPSSVRVPPTGHIRRHAARLLTILSVLPKVQKMIVADDTWCKWLEDCANGRIQGCNDAKIQSYARATLLNVFCNDQFDLSSGNDNIHDTDLVNQNRSCPYFADMIFLINPELSHWKCPAKINADTDFRMPTKKPNSVDKSSPSDDDSVENEDISATSDGNGKNLCACTHRSESCSQSEVPLLDVVFVHGLRGGPFKTWRLAEDKESTKSGLVEKIDEEAGKQGTFWPGEWLSADFPRARLFSIKYKSNLTQWSGASLPLQEVSSMLLEKLVDAGIGNRPVVFVTHSMGGLVVKQMLNQAKAENKDNLVNNTIGLVFYSCPHFGSKLADMPWRMGLVFRPAPTIGELRSGSPRLVELNDFIRHLYKKGLLEVLSFCETKVTPIVEGYGGWAFRMEIVPIESAYPGFGELVHQVAYLSVLF